MNILYYPLWFHKSNILNSKETSCLVLEKNREINVSCLNDNVLTHQLKKN